MQYINCLNDLKRQLNHPYRSGEFLTNGTSIFEVDEDDNINESLIESCEPGTLIYGINWEDPHFFTENGVHIPAIYN